MISHRSQRSYFCAFPLHIRYNISRYIWSMKLQVVFANGFRIFEIIFALLILAKSPRGIKLIRIDIELLHNAFHRWIVGP